MARPEKIGADYVAWARRRNNRWIVHHGLSKKTDSYLDHLAKTDPQRLSLSCRNAHLLVQKAKPDEDPKPWFYSGVFSLATAAETQRYLAGHWFLSMTVAPDSAATEPQFSSENVSSTTIDKIKSIREAIAQLPGA
jgi:hypothetical protein